jgi:hypothetical protein
MTIMAAAFAAAALLQYNDADALRWILVYGVAAVLSGVAAWRGAAPAAAAVCLAAVALTWAVVLAAGLPTVSVYARVFDGWRMESSGVEEARESLGLFLVAACAAVIAAVSRGRRVNRAL